MNAPQEGATATYTRLPGFEALVLEDSWILAVVATPAELVIEADLATSAWTPSSGRDR